MFKSKTSKLFTLTFTLTFFLLFYTINFNSPQQIFFPQNSLRKLVNNEDVKEICEKSDSNIVENFNETDFSYKMDNYNENKWANYIIEYIQTEESSNFIKKYYKRILPFAIFIVFSIILIFFWLGYCCCCCPCCCCRQKGKENCCRFFSFLVVLIMNGIVIVGCVYGLATTKKIV